MLYLFFFVVVSIEICVGWTIYVFTGMRGQAFNVYPAWLWEVLFSFYWFSFVFATLNKKYFDVTQPRSYVWELKPLAGWALSIHFVSAYLLSLAILPLMGVALLPRVLIAYLGSYALSVAIPMQLAMMFYPRYQKRLESDRIPASQIRDMALRSPSAQQFTQRYPNYLAFVCDNAHKNKVASCLFLDRRSRPEREGFMEDIVLEIPVDMQTKEPIEDKIKTSHYVYRNGAEGCAVMHLSDKETTGDGDRAPEPLDFDLLRRFDSLMERFPLLDKIPFPLAVRDTPHERI
jgi:hypothetical protein